MFAECAGFGMRAVTPTTERTFPDRDFCEVDIAADDFGIDGGDGTALLRDDGDGVGGHIVFGATKDGLAGETAQRGIAERLDQPLDHFLSEPASERTIRRSIGRDVDR